MAAASNFRIEGKSREELQPRREVSLDALPFPAALLDRNGLICATNAAWDTARREEQYKSSSIQAGIQDVLQGKRERFSETWEDGRGERHAFTVTGHRGGALVVQHPPEATPSRYSRRMEIMGRLVGGVAHDFANLLTLIGGYTDILLHRLNERDPSRFEVDEIQKAANRGAQLTGQLLGFTRGESASPRVLDLNDIVQDTEKLLRPLIGEHVQLRTVLSPSLYKILADPCQIEQVVMNMLLNARDAMPHGGRIFIETSNREVDAETARLHALQPGSFVMLSITDTGHGIDAKVMDRIWEPLFTTKERGKGTGLGLSTVKKLIQESHGAVWVQSTPGHGTTFSFCLPRAEQSPDKAGSVLKHPAVQAGHETVLVVEDEESVRKLLTDVLRRRGYRVLEAGDGAEALHIYEERHREIHLILTDMVMPKMTGPELASQVVRIHPGARILFMSGYTDDILRRTGALGSGMSLLQKPLRPETLAAKVREALDSAS
ncbi:MAG: hybrid sensor histidine kinase/response regulator [Terriglobia bacterium]|nr:MAG: hybrid sensor histidine kinase/response regulator [Terriglobia bacterium]